MIDIEYKTIKVPTKINVDGIDYPIHSHNIEVVREYEKTGDKEILNKLRDFSLDISF